MTGGMVGVGLFSGVGGMELALHHAGIPPAALCEIDPHARAVLTRRFPGVPLFDDVRKVTGDQLRHLGIDPARTVLTAGFPCQDLSVAGRRAGLDHGERSGLFWEIHRVLGEFPAAWVLLENVAGLLSAVCPCPGDGLCVARRLTVRCPGGLHTVPGGACDGQCVARHGGAMGAVLGALGERGYGFAYRVLDAQHFGVPQRRRRVFIVGRRPGGPGITAPAQVLLEPARGGRDSAARATPGPVPTRWAAASVDEPRLVGALTARAGNTQDDQQTTQLVVSALTSSMAGSGGGADASEDGTGRCQPIIAFSHTAGLDEQASEHTAPTVLAGHDRMPAVSGHTVVRRLTPLECERLQGFPDGWCDQLTDTARYRAMGNAVAVPVVAWIAERIVAVEAAAEIARPPVLGRDRIP